MAESPSKDENKFYTTRARLVNILFAGIIMTREHLQENNVSSIFICLPQLEWRGQEEQKIMVDCLCSEASSGKS